MPGSTDVRRHRLDTGHGGHALATTDCPPGRGSSRRARAEALAATRAAIDNAKHRTDSEEREQ